MSDREADGIPCLWMRGGTSKGAYFLASDLPGDRSARDALLLRILGSPDPRQIDGIGGADPLTSKVAILSPPSRPDADVDYLFLQVFVDQPIVTDAQPCGNILAGVGPAALERGLVAVTGDVTPVRIHMLNTGEVATARVETPNRRVNYAGTAAIDGVPGSAAAVPLMFGSVARSMTGALLPTGQARDIIDGVPCTLIDNGIPCVILAAVDVGVTGTETREALEADAGLKGRLESIRLVAGRLMNLGDVTAKSVPKMTLVSAPVAGGAIATRSFIPHRVHALDRRARRRHRGDRLPAEGEPGRGARPHSARWLLPDRASDRRRRGAPRPRRRRHPARRRHHPDRAQALRRAGLPRPRALMAAAPPSAPATARGRGRSWQARHAGAYRRKAMGCGDLVALPAFQRWQ
jgi:4-oxalomesaconate tautomerase